MSTGSASGRPWGPLRGDTPEADALARFLRHQMDQSSTTLRELSEQLAYSRSRISEYLSGRAIPPWEFIQKFLYLSSPKPLHERRLAEARHLLRSAIDAKYRPATPDAPSRHPEVLAQVIEAQRRTIEMADRLSKSLEQLASISEQLHRSQQLNMILLQLAFTRPLPELPGRSA
ncbi:helix-turn-helix domain-containing protein [Streptomyces sp. MB09-01]|uniref:helix-turn-helix domain-containing protein n=1 Tax=Streptomyces sp. MB09-01 TaxID=3028666 RepID=UPI003A5C3736